MFPASSVDRISLSAAVAPDLQQQTAAESIPINEEDEFAELSDDDEAPQLPAKRKRVETNRFDASATASAPRGGPKKAKKVMCAACLLPAQQHMLSKVTH